MKKLVSRALAVALLSMFFASMSWAQITGDLQINVSDATGGAVPNASITVRNLGTGATRTLTGSAEDGSARVPQLAIGEYEVSVTAAGFAKAQSRGTVNSGAITTVPIRLEIQGTAQEIIITDSALSINTVNAQLQTTATTKQIMNLPIVATSGILGLAGTAPGVTPVSVRNPFLGAGSFNSNGGRGRGNNITIDNATATDVSTTGSAGLGTIPIDGIKELTIIANQFSAEYGRNSSAQVQILTKNGTNDFHGSLFHFFRNDKLNARDYFDRTGQASILRDNNWGGSVQGPIVKNKLLFAGTYEQKKIRGAGSTRVATVPTPAQAASAVPAIRQLLERYLVPTSATGTVGNAAGLTTNSWAFSTRADWNISDNDVVFIRYGYFDNAESSASLTFVNSNLPTGGATAINAPHNATVSYTRTVSPSVVNVLLGSFGRSAPVFTAINSFGGPEVLFSDGAANMGIWAGLPQGRVQNTYQLQNVATWIAGRHQFKLGGEINRIHANSFFDSNVRGTLSFATMADFLAARPTAYSQRFGNSVRGNRVWNEFFFLQDDWKVTPALTLNLGLRMEVAHGATEINGLLSNLNLDKREPLGGAGTGPLGAFDVGGSFHGTNYNWGPRVGFAWNPSQGKTVIRGGYGVAYDFIFLNPITNGRFLPPFMYNFSLPATDVTGDNSVDRILAGTSAFQASSGAIVGTFGATIRNFGSIGPVAQNLRNPQVHQWSLSFERDFWSNTLGRISYTGTKSNFLQRSRPINPIPLNAFQRPRTLEEEAAMNTAGVFRAVQSASNAGLTTPTNRVDPRFTTVALAESSANSNYHSLQAYLARRFSGGFSFTAAYTWSKSIDDISDALNVISGDTPTRQNPFDNRENRAVSGFDVPHRFVLTHLYEPQVFATLSNGFARAILHGWQWNGIFQAQSGTPVNLFSGARLGLNDPALLGNQTTGAGTTRPNLVAPLNLKLVPNPGAGASNPNLVTNSGLAQPLVGSLGNLGRNVIRVNRFLNFDWTAAKEFAITERVRTQFQAHLYNVFNNTTFARPGATLSAPATFGYYADADTNARNITFVLRLIW